MSEIEPIQEMHSVLEEDSPELPTLETKRQTEEEVFTEVELLESRRYGEEYVGLVHNVMGTAQTKIDGERLGVVSRSIDNHLEQQRILANLRQASARNLLSEIFPMHAAQGLFDDEESYSLINMANGMFRVHLERATYQQIARGAQALAIKNPAGISFILTSPDTNLEENVPHETQHIMFDFMKRDGLVINQEDEPEVRKAYFMFKDEVLSRLVSDGGFLRGYSHLQMLSSEEIEALDPMTVNVIKERVIGLNELLEEIELALFTSDMQKSDLIKTVMEAKDFNALAQELGKILRYIQEHSTIQEDAGPEPTTGGWGSA